jgi:hypothetical protein
MRCQARRRKASSRGADGMHARGQEFKSPQLHPRPKALSAIDRPRIARLGQQIRSNRLCVADAIVQGGGYAGQHRRGRLPVDAAHGAAAGAAVAAPACMSINSSMTREGMAASSSQVAKVCRRSWGPGGPGGRGRPWPPQRWPIDPPQVVGGCLPSDRHLHSCLLGVQENRERWNGEVHSPSPKLDGSDPCANERSDASRLVPFVIRLPRVAAGAGEARR